MTLTLQVVRCPDAAFPETKRITGGEYKVGRGPGNNWVLQDPEKLVSRSHFTVTYGNGGWMVTDTSSSGLFINGGAALGEQKSRALQNGDVLRLGNFEIEARIEEPEGGFDSRPSGMSAGGFGGGMFNATAPEPFAPGQGGFTSPMDDGPSIFDPPPMTPPIGGGVFNDVSQQIGGGFNDGSPAFGGGGFGNASAPSGGGAFDVFGGFIGSNTGATQSDHSSALNDAYVPKSLSLAPPDSGADPWGNVSLPPQIAPQALPPGGDPWGDLSPAAPSPPPQQFQPQQLPQQLPQQPPPPQGFGAPVPPPANQVFNPAPSPVPQSPLPLPVPMAAPAAAPVAMPFMPLPAASPASPQAAPQGFGAAFDNVFLEPGDTAGIVAPSSADPVFEQLPLTPAALPMPFAAVITPIAPENTFPPMQLQAAPPPPQALAPAPVAAPATAPAPVATPAAAPAAAPPAVADEKLLAAFMAGAGLRGAKPDDPEALMTRMGAALRAAVSGVRQALIARASIKNEFRIEQTMIRARGNNPLKFSADDDDALAALCGLGRRADMPAETAIADALRDMRLHELATMLAMQEAVRALVKQLDPEKLRAEADTGGMALAAQKKARAFEAYEKLHARVTQALADDFDSVFGKSFAIAYETAMRDVSARDAK